MSCNNPILRHRKNGTLVFSPCKTCIGCRNDRREDFSKRLQMDYIVYGYVGSFITLTYRDSDLPQLLPLGSAVVGKYFKRTPPGVLYRPHLQNFMDNLNHKCKKLFGLPIRYVSVGEYGEDKESYRPHYHAIVLGLPNYCRDLLLDTWSFGLVDIAPITKADIRYTLSYIDKQMYGADCLYSTYGDYQPPFANFSKGLGTLFYHKHKQEFDSLGRFYFSGDKSNYFELNKYYKDKYGYHSKTVGLVPSDIVELSKQQNKSVIDVFDNQNYLKEEKLIHKSHLKGVPIQNTLRDLNIKG